MSFQDLTRARYSCRSYEQRPVEPAKLEAIIEAGRIAPSAHNNHPTRLIVCDTPETLERAARAAYRFARDGSVFGAPVVLVVCAVENDAWVRRPDGMNSSLIDTSIVCDQMMMQATDLGLGTCWVCMFDPDIARSEFDLPEGVEPISMLTVGYAADHIADADAREARCIPHEDFVLP
ncbi:nitroreductase family protein [Collinsella tanakaei]|uniref:nitroreductase family protein n=1 Tax=Collinsella tanakaei TaxID=626935 RepID=UPI001F25A4F3|nr:nitroreductase family protein [Collinsella tanakaei]MCF2621032.1 nitroreductase family protein [Collinsella tanakaei]